MKVIELNRDEYLISVKKIADFKSLSFSKSALEWWDNYYSWEKFPPLCLVNDKKKHVCFYKWLLHQIKHLQNAFFGLDK